MFKSRTFIAVGALAVAGGATAYQLTRTDPHRGGQAAQKSPLPELKKDAIDELEISEPGKPPVVLKKEGAEWKLTAPVADRADAQSVNEALDALEKLKLKDVIAEQTTSYDKVQVKDDEVVKVVPKKAGQALTTLLLGKTTNVRLDKDPRVWSTNSLRRAELVRELKMWRDREIVKLDLGKLDKIEAAYDGAKVVVKREPPPAPASQPADSKLPSPPPGPDKWVLVEGQDKIGGNLDHNVALGLASTLVRLDADDFAAPTLTPEAAGFDRPRVTVTATLTDGAQKTVIIGKQDGDTVYAKRPDSPRIWKLRKWDAERFVASPAQWRDKTLMKIASNDVAKIELTKGTDHVVLERGDKGWKATAPADFGDVDENKVNMLLRNVAELTATRVADDASPATAGLDKPAAVVTFTRKDGTASTLTVGAKAKEDTLVQVSGQSDIFGLPEYLASQFLKPPSDLKKKATAAAPVPAP